MGVFAAASELSQLAGPAVGALIGVLGASAPSLLRRRIDQAAHDVQASETAVDVAAKAVETVQKMQEQLIAANERTAALARALAVRDARIEQLEADLGGRRADD